MPEVSVVVTNYNGRENLATCLPAVIAATLADPAEGGTDPVCEIIVVDDCSDDDSVEWIRTTYPQIVCLPLEKRTGFQGAANAGFERARGDLVLLLSNDMAPTPGLFKNLMTHFEDPSIFAVACSLMDPDGTPQSGRCIGTFITGNLQVLDSAKGYRPFGSFIHPRSDVPCATLYTGGNALFSREKFLELGGFDSLYHPFYWEDVDLCYRAWRKGYRILFDPRIRIVHNRSAGTIRRHYSREYAQTIRRRNRLLFTWRNLRDPGYWLLHLLALSGQLLVSWVLLDFRFYSSLGQAVRRIGPVLERRRRDALSGGARDREILSATSLEPDSVAGTD